MELYLQLGYGMMAYSRTLIGNWGGGSVILSPRDLDEVQLARFAKEILDVNGNVLFDSQFYLPRSDHRRLRSHSYWPSEYDTAVFWEGEFLKKLLNDVWKINKNLNCSTFILPGLYAEDINAMWLHQQNSIIEQAVNSYADDLKIFATISLSAEVVQNTEKIHELLEESRSWNIDGIYLICEHPDGDYIVDNHLWLSNTLDLIAGFSLRRKFVLVGYCHHQSLILGTAGADAIASGTWMNVRSFPPEKFRQRVEERQDRTRWYYCPQALSEFTTTFLDVAYHQGILQIMRATDEDLIYAHMLFEGNQPSNVGFDDAAAFLHYLQCLRTQTMKIEQPTFQQTVDVCTTLLDGAEDLLKQLHGQGVRGQGRDFLDSIDPTRAALSIFEANRGAQLRREWGNIVS